MPEQRPDRTQVKICGITDMDDALLLNDLGFGALGFILYVKSPRSTQLDFVEKLKPRLNPFIKLVAVTVNHEDIFAVHKSGLFDIQQLHGDEPTDTVLKLQDMNATVMRVFRVGGDSVPTDVTENPADLFLLDTYKKDLYGGTGETFNWDILKNYKFTKPAVLSGGLGAHNILEAYRATGCPAYDISSSLEERPGKKSRQKIMELYNLLSNNRGE